jgi:hypothetical protein
MAQIEAILFNCNVDSVTSSTRSNATRQKRLVVPWNCMKHPLPPGQDFHSFSRSLQADDGTLLIPNPYVHTNRDWLQSHSAPCSLCSWMTAVKSAERNIFTLMDRHNIRGSTCDRSPIYPHNVQRHASVPTNLIITNTLSAFTYNINISACMWYES